VRVQVAKRALVCHQAKGNAVADPHADLVRVGSAKRDAAASGTKTIPGLEVSGRRMVDEAIRSEHEAENVSDALDALGAVGDEAPKLDSRITLALEVPPRHSLGSATESRRSRREGMGQEAEAPFFVDSCHDLCRPQAAMVDRTIEPECQIVVFPVRRHLD